MHALVVYCHPSPQSYTAAVRDVVLAKLRDAGAQVTLIDLYAEGFAPKLAPEEWHAYDAGPSDQADLSRHITAVNAADTLIFVYPTWWYGLPALLKGWLDRVMLPGVAFNLPPNGPITPKLRHIKRMGVFTTCGASWWLTTFIGSPGRRTLLWGVGLLCARRLRRVFCAHYAMDTSTPASRAAHLRRVDRGMDRLLRGATALGAAQGEPTQQPSVDRG